MLLYSVGLRIEGKSCLVVGGGVVAFERATKLYEAGADLSVVSMDFVPRFAGLGKAGLIHRRFESADLEGRFMVIAATGDRKVNRQIGSECTALNILYNVADDPNRCQFVVPAVITRGPLQISLTTGGASPAYAARLRQDIQEVLPGDLEGYMKFLELARARCREAVPDLPDRLAIGRFLASKEGYERYSRFSQDELEGWIDELLYNRKKPKRDP